MVENRKEGSELLALLRKPIVWVTGCLAAIALILANANAALRDARSLPNEWEKTSKEFGDWYYEYDAWKGRWTTVPEGWVDAEDWDLGPEDLHLQFDIREDRTIDGIIENRSICNRVPVFEFLLVDGEITTAKTAEFKVWDIVDGKRQDFATLKLERDDLIITVRPLVDPANLFPKTTRIARIESELPDASKLALTSCPDKWPLTREAQPVVTEEH